jgi:ABC-2 type transport system ATP-binding protein
MIHDPRLLILDEPASNLDPRARIELRELLKELRALGKTIMISSHILTELAELCTHIAIIERGRLLAAGDVQTILRSLQPHRTLELRVLTAAERVEALLRDQPDVLDVRRAIADAPAVPSQPHGDGDGAAPEALAAHTPGLAEDADGLGQPTTFLVDYAGDERGMGGLLTLLVANGVGISRFAEQSSGLEDIFMQVTKGIVQ